MIEYEDLARVNEPFFAELRGSFEATLLSGPEFPISEQVHATTMSLPVSSAHTEEDIRAVARELNRL